MRLVYTEPFLRDFQALPAAIQPEAEKAIRLLVENPRHPSLHFKKMRGLRNVWEVRVTRSYRITLTRAAGVIILRRIGTHDILRTP